MSLNDQLPPVRPPIIPHKFRRHHAHRRTRHHASHDTRVQSRMVFRGVLLPEHQRAHDASHADTHDQHRHRRQLLAVGPDVVGRVRHGCRRVGLGAHAREANAEVAQAERLGEAEQRDPHDAEERVEHDVGAAQALPVGRPARRAAPETRGEVGRCVEQLRDADREAHAAEDEGEEVDEALFVSVS